MTLALADWNKSSFGNIFKDLDCLHRRLNGIQMSGSYMTSTFLHNLERELHHQCAIKLCQVEHFWAQRSQINWLTQGDSNSCFFHLAAKLFHRKTKIPSLTTEQGLKITAQQEMETHCHSFFRTWFAAPLHPQTREEFIMPRSLPVCLTPSENANLSNLPTANEIHHDVFSINPNKA